MTLTNLPLLASGGGGAMPTLADLDNLFWGFMNPAHPEGLFLLFVYAGGALAISFMCSLLEATLLSVRVTELMQRAETDPGAKLLLEYKQEKVEEGIGAILTLNTVAHTIGASLAGAQAAHVFASDTLSAELAVGGFSAILTVAVLVATEIIPKTLGTNYASALTPFVGRAIRALAFMLKPILVITGMITHLIASKEPEGINRGELQALVTMAQRDGAIASDESRVLTNFLEFDALSVADVMTPRTVLGMVSKDATIAEFIADPSLHYYSRLPVYSDSPDTIVGYVHQRELLLHGAKTGDFTQPILPHRRDILEMPDTTTLGEALRVFLDKGDHIAIAQGEFGGTSGLVTLEDVVESILGAEIVDEADKHADLRAVASELREKRAARRAKAQGKPSA